MAFTDITDEQLGEIVSTCVAGTDPQINAVKNHPALADARPDELFMLSQGLMVAAGQLQQLSDDRRATRVNALKQTWSERP